MSVSELQGLIVANTSPLLGEATKGTLRSILETAESEAILQARSMPADPALTDPKVLQEAMATKRAELTAEAIMGFLNSMQTSTAQATAEAVVSFLSAHSTAALIPGSLVVPNPPGVPIPVIATGPISTIVY